MPASETVTRIYGKGDTQVDVWPGDQGGVFVYAYGRVLLDVQGVEALHVALTEASATVASRMKERK